PAARHPARGARARAQDSAERARRPRRKSRMSAGLAALQSRLKASILASTEPGELLKPTLQGGPPRIGIYRDAYWMRLAEALASNFPILKLTLGDDDFESLARAYIDAYPSNRPSIRWYGKDLVAWLDADPGRVAHAALIDLARMEWALGTAFDAADGSTVSFE